MYSHLYERIIKNDTLCVYLLYRFYYPHPQLFFSQADNEIQVYASPTIQHHRAIFELHNNYTFKGSKFLSNPKEAKWYNTMLEITHGFEKILKSGFTHSPVFHRMAVINISVIKFA
jgi:hypothetical protein